MLNKKSKVGRLLAYLSKGYDITENQAANKFGIANLSAAQTYLRDKGFAVYRNRKNINGYNVTVYRLGTPSREVVAAGFRALRQGI